MQKFDMLNKLCLVRFFKGDEKIVSNQDTENIMMFLVS